MAVLPSTSTAESTIYQGPNQPEDREDLVCCLVLFSQTTTITLPGVNKDVPFLFAGKASGLKWLKSNMVSYRIDIPWDPCMAYSPTVTININ